MGKKNLMKVLKLHHRIVHCWYLTAVDRVRGRLGGVRQARQEKHRPGRRRQAARQEEQGAGKSHTVRSGCIGAL